MSVAEHRQLAHRAGMVFETEAVCFRFDDSDARQPTVDLSFKPFYFPAMTRSDSEQQLIVLASLQRGINRVKVLHVGIPAKRRGNR